MNEMINMIESIRSQIDALDQQLNALDTAFFVLQRMAGMTAAPPEDAPACRHEHKEDVGGMADAPGRRWMCADCGQRGFTAGV